MIRSILGCMRALFTRKLIQCSQTTIAVADSSKIGKRTVASL
ncbi:hypothetical protein [Paenibacillus catalpae]|nr:hypothetical protein [Paenibacillus catalpae]